MDPVELVADVPCRTGEGPLWHSAESCLYWMDIPNGHLFRHSPSAAVTTQLLAGPMLGADCIQRDGSLLLLGWRGRISRFHEGTLSHITTVAALRGTRFNDARADSTGRVFAGTIPTPTSPSRLIAIYPDGSAHTVVERLGQSNGMAFSADETTLYHVDTTQHVIRAYVYDRNSGEVGSCRIVAQFTESEGAPDGMAIDEEGCLWIALWGGGCVIRIDVQGRRLSRVSLPTPLTSSLAFGGPKLEDLYITTAGGDRRDRHGSLAGSVFMVSPGVRGILPAASAVGMPGQDRPV